MSIIKYLNIFAYLMLATSVHGETLIGERSLAEIAHLSVEPTPSVNQSATPLFPAPLSTAPQLMPFTALPTLSGIYSSSDKSVAEFVVDGKTKYAVINDKFKDGWVVKKIGTDVVILEQCSDKTKKCKERKMHLEVD